MYIYKPKGSKFFWFEFRQFGKRFRGTTKLTDERKAERFAHRMYERVNDRRSGKIERATLPTLTEAAREYQKYLTRKRRPLTAERVRVSLTPVLAHFGKKRLDEITISAVYGYQATRLSKKSPMTKRLLSPISVNRELGTGRALYNFFTERFEDLRNPFAFKGYAKETAWHHRILTSQEEERYLAVCSPTLRDLAIVMLGAGLRPNEVVNLTKSDVRLNENYVVVQRGKTDNARRTIPLTQKVAAVLAYRMAIAKGTHLFPKRGDPNAPMLKVNKAHATALRRSGITPPFRLYDLRHSFASRLMAAGADLASVRELLGHSKNSVAVTMRYIHGTSEQKEKVMSQLENFNAAAETNAKHAENAEVSPNPAHSRRLQ